MLVPVVLPPLVTVKATLPAEGVVAADESIDSVAEVGAEDVTTAAEVIVPITLPELFFNEPLSVIDVPDVARAEALL